jgi:hypothetical protein
VAKDAKQESRQESRDTVPPEKSSAQAARSDPHVKVKAQAATASLDASDKSTAETTSHLAQLPAAQDLDSYRNPDSPAELETVTASMKRNPGAKVNR